MNTIQKIKQLEKKIEKLEKENYKLKKEKIYLKSSEERFRLLFEDAPDGYFLCTLKGTFLDGNKAAEKLIGCKRNELIGKNMLELNLVDLKQMPKIAKRLAEHALGRPAAYDEFTLNRKDGTKIAIETSGTVVNLEDKKLILGIVRDITERKKTEEELKEKNEELEKFNKFAVGRELKIIELKNKIKELEKKGLR
ncbi:MAG: PAS domain S-box protein [Candidatus Nealsonbacteria bacterium]|nr:PAS domain S-box protein [Candidatus Nealsonbacteria bacterium]